MPAAAVVHRLRHVEQHREVRVRLGLVLLHVVAVGPRPQLPVHAADVVARHVAAMLGEVDRRAEVRRLVHAVDEAVDDRARHELQVPDAREHRGIHEARAGDGALACDRPATLIYIPDPRHRHDLEQPIGDLIGRHAFRLRVEVGDDAVAQHRVRQRADVVEAHVVAAARERARLAAEHEVLRRADAGAERDPLLHEVRRRPSAFGRLARTMSSAWRITGSATGTLRTSCWNAIRSSPLTGRSSFGS